MSVLPVPISASPAREYPLSVATYHAMIAAGTLTEEDPVELIEGELLFKMPKDKPHRSTCTRLNSWLSTVLPSGWAVQVQDPITLPTSEPEPDVCCVTQASVDGSDPHPTAADVGLLSRSRIRRSRSTAHASCACTPAPASSNTGSST